MSIVDRLLGALRGPLDAVPGPARQVAATLPVVGPFFTPTAGLLMRYGLAPLMEKDQQLGRDFAGGLIQDVLNPIGLPLQERFAPDTALTATMRQIAALPERHPGEAIGLLRHSPDRGAAYLGGGLEMASDPLNVAGPAASGFAREAELARLATVLGMGDRLQALPGEATAAGVRALRNRLALRQVGETAGLDTPELVSRAAARDPLALAQLRAVIESPGAAGDVPAKLLPPMGEGRGLGPPQPPPLRIPPLTGLRRERITGLDQPDVLPLGPRQELGYLPIRPAADFNTRAGGARGNLPTVKGPTLPPELGPLLPPALGPTLDRAGNVPRQELPLVGGKRQIGPPALPKGAVTPAQEVAAKVLPAATPPPAATPFMPRTVTAPPATREAGLAALSGQETNTLLALAYDHPNAVRNAQTKYPDVLDLRARAIERIQTTPKLTAKLAQRDPALAAKVAALPDELPNGTIAPPPAEPWTRPLDDLLAEGADRAAHLPKPSVPAPAGRTYYHVAPESYRPGDPLLSAAELKRQRGIDVQDKWGEDYPNYLKSPDAKQVSLTETYAEAVDYLHSFLNGQGRILAVDVPTGAKVTRNGEGYPVVKKLVPGAWAREVPVPPEMANVTFGTPPAVTAVSGVTPRMSEAAPLTPAQARAELFADAADVGPAVGAAARRVPPRGRQPFQGQMGGQTSIQKALADVPPPALTPRERWVILRKQADERLGQTARPDALWNEVHRENVQRAIARGDTLPPEVLADYPELAPTPGGDLAAGGGGVVTGPAREANLARFMAGAHPLLRNADGSPKVLYHGTQAGDFDRFAVPDAYGDFGQGIYLTADAGHAGQYAGRMGQEHYGSNITFPVGEAGPNIKPVYAALKHPLIMAEHPELLTVPRDRLRAVAEAQGYDGIIVTGDIYPGGTNRGLEEVVAFDPAAIKSASGNRGTFDPNDPHLLRAIPYPGGLSGPVGRAIVPAAGAGTGAAIGYATGDTPEDARANALKGAAIGGGLGLGREFRPELARAAVAAARPGSTWRVAGEHALTAGRAEQAASNALGFTQGIFPGRGDWVPFWKRNVVETGRNWGQDESWGRVVLRALQPGGRLNLKALRQEAAQALGAATDWLKLPVSTRGMLTDIGREDYVPRLGESLAQSTAGKRRLSTIQSATGGAVLALPAAGNVGGVALAAAEGAGRPWWHGVFRTINDFQHRTFRLAAFNDELAGLLEGGATDFLAGLERQGVDVTALRPRAGGFSPREAGTLAGQTAQAQWQAITEKAVALAEGRTKFLFGDYGQTGAIERTLGKGLPFASWAVRAYPVAVRMALDHPVVALALYQYFRATSAGAGQNGRPGWTAGMMPIPTSTPFVGPVLSALVPGNNGVVYLDPVGTVTPVGGELFAPAEDAPGDSWYQKATKFIARTGLPGPSPAIQAGAYATGLDYRAPGPLSRTAGIESAAGLIPGNPALPAIGPNALAATRRRVSPYAAEFVPGAEADPNAQPYDPITRRYAELVREETGLPLTDPSNRAYLIALTDEDNPLVQQARREVLLSGAAKNAASLTSPVGAAAQTRSAKEYKAAQAGVPFSAERVATAVPALAAAMTQANDTYAARNPALATYQGTTPFQRETALADQFAATPDMRYMQRVAPRSYAQNRAMQQLQLWEFDHKALKKSNRVEYDRQRQKKVKALNLE